MLSISGFSKSYDGKTNVVEDINLEILAGDIYGFIGHNGAGKTTTIKAVVGLLPYRQGSISIDGMDVQTHPEETKRLFAYIPDDPQLYETLTGLQYLNFIADVFHVSANNRQKRIKKYAERLGMERRLNDPINSYSHGMKQKLEIVGALIHNPKLLILDEPFVGLDPKAAFTLKEMMREFCAGGGAIFFSTHVLEVAEKLCNKIAVIKNGRIIANGEMDEVIGNQSLEEVFLELTDNESV